jgi:iron complex outermembrane receptor protein
VKRTRTTGLAACLLLAPLAAVAQEEVVVLDPIEIRLPAAADDTDANFGASRPDAADQAARKATTGDAAELLRGIPGVTLDGAGGISSLPAIHGLSDQRLRIQVDGADLVAACPNHMNSPLSYADPARIDTVTVFSGATPVSVGGDSIGGSIQVRSAPPEFAGEKERFLVRGRAGSFYRTNGGAYGYGLAVTGAGRWLNLRFDQSSSWSDDLAAGGAFKPVAPGTEGGPPIPGDVIASSDYRAALRRSLALSLRRNGHLLQLEAARQTVGFEGFPNQRMDMTMNDNRTFTVRYTGILAWGDLEARAGYQTTRHEMDMGPDRYTYGTGMPMETDAKTRSALLKANVILSSRHLLRAGAEWQYHTLYDWWPPVGGSMGPNTFWNVDFGERRRLGAYAEWEGRWSKAWTGLAGVRGEAVTTDAGPVQGYDNGLPAWGDDAAAFNAAQRRRTDLVWDLTASARHVPGPTQTYEAGYARKSRSPGLYERYPWSTNAMAALMNNLVGDGNGYVGNLDLAPEVAHTVSITGDWHAEDAERWGVRATAHATRVHDYVDARRCDFGQCSPANVTATTGFVLLQYANREARLYGADLTARLQFAGPGRLGSLGLTAALGWVHGDDLTTGDGLHAILPPNATVALVHRLAGWTATVEIVAVADKDHVSAVRNEVRTGGYALLHARASHAWKHVRLDVGVENLLGRLHDNPTGGAYLGQGSSMSTTGIPWGVAVPGPGRSLAVALAVTL